jgi:hypothetical protein
MFGHTHEQYFSIASARDNNPMHVSQIGPSATSHEYRNPGYAVLHIDRETLLPLNYQVYSLDIELEDPEWTLTIDYVKDYNLTDVSPASMQKLAERLREDESLARLFTWNESRNVGWPPEFCDKACRRALFCRVSTSETVDHAACMHEKPGNLFD